MADGNSRYPSLGTPIFGYATSASFPATSYNGALALALDSDILYVYNTGSVSWVAIGGPSGGLSVGALDAQAENANGAAIVAGVLSMQSADATHPGLVNNTSQTLSGAKTFSSTIVGNISGNAATVTTNANLTGVITSVGNATSIASQTGIGTKFVVDTSPTLVTPALGTPTALVGTNITGTASGLTAGNVTTNANLTGPITSVGNATALAAQTGTGSVFVVQASPTLTAPIIGAATGTSLSVSGQLTSTVATGTAPLVVSSTTQVANLNAATAGTATTATTATNATNIAITDDTTTNATMYPVWVTANTGNLPSTVSSTKLTFNPSTAALTTTTFVGALTGTASGNTTYSANNHGLVISSATNAMTVIAPDSSTSKVLVSGGSSANPAWGTVTSVLPAFTGDITSSAGAVATTAAATQNNITSIPNLATVGTISSGTWSGTTIALNKGGTGATTAAGAVNAIIVAPTAVKVTTYAIQTTDQTVLLDNSGGSFTTTLPTAVGVAGKRYTIKVVTQAINNPITIATTSSQTIDGVTTRKLYTQYEQFTVESDNANWQVLSHTYPEGWTSYTPTYTGFGTVSGSAMLWRRVGDSVEVRGSVTTGTNTSTTAAISLPSGATSASTITANETAGVWQRNVSQAAAYYVLNQPSSTTVNLGIQTGSVSGQSPTNAQNTNNGEILMFNWKTPITGWEA